MLDKQAIEKRLNSDDEFRSRFMSDPITVLKEAGMTISEKDSKRLTQQLDDLKGKTAPPGASLAADGISINISKSF